MKTLTRREWDLHVDALREMGILDKMRAICTKHHVLFEDVLSPLRTKQVYAARVACIVYLRGLGMSSPEIGRIMMRDHAGVLAALKKTKGAADGTEVSGRGGGAHGAAEGAREGAARAAHGRRSRAAS